MYSLILVPRFTLLLTDVKTLSNINISFKYCDDTNPFVTESRPTDVDVTDEFDNTKWTVSEKINTTINMT